MPLVSIVIPSYNSEKYIADTIDSILKQSLKDFELIIVDDGSKDRTPAIVSEYESPVRLITQTNAGVCVARNRGLKEAQGQFICFMDHDDYWFPEKLARQIEVFTSHPEAGVVYSSFVRWHISEDAGFPAPDSFDIASIPDEIDPEFSGWIYHHFLIDCWMLTSTAMFRVDVLQECGGFDVTLPYSEDWELWLRISRVYPMIKLKRPTTLYRQHKDQGNLVVRDVDFRTSLLTNTVEKWGFYSNDGRRTNRHQFFKQLALYHASFALSHLNAGKLDIALRSFLKAWRCAPSNLKYLAYIPMALLGWKPKY